MSSHSELCNGCVIGEGHDWSPANMKATSVGDPNHRPLEGGGNASGTLGVDTIQPSPKMETKLYKRRWVMLFIFSMYSMSNSFMWIQYSSINDIFMNFYNVNSVAIDWLAMLYLLVYVILILPAMWMLETRGLREVLIVGSACNAIGAWVKTSSADPSRFSVTVLGQVICSAAVVFILGVPSRLSSLWFGQHEVATACSIGVLGNQLGSAIGFLLPPILVPNVDDMDELAYHIRVMFYITAGVTTVLFVLIIVVFQDKPATPPTRAQAHAKLILSEGGSYTASLLRLLRNRDFMLLLLTYGINIGTFYSFSTLLNRMIIEYYPGEEVNAGRIGLTLVLAGIVGSIFGGVWVDRTKTYKQTSFAMYLMSLIGMLLFAFTFNLGHIWLVFVTAGIFGCFMGSYLPLGFEFGVELTYPEAEGTSSGLLNSSAQIFGIILIISQGKIIDKWGVFSGNIFLSSFLLLGTIITVYRAIIEAGIWGRTGERHLVMDLLQRQNTHLPWENGRGYGMELWYLKT